MKVTQVSICPTEASVAGGKPALTPELLAASGARYSRNNEGLDAILSKIDPNNLDRSVDGIFKMIDYGHQSIADMVPVALFIDDISIYLAYHLWTLCPTAGGQESSTRYIKMSLDGLVDSDTLGIPGDLSAEWQGLMETSFAAYQAALSLWEEIVAQDAMVARIPTHLLNDPSDKASKQVARMKRNYSFDRARYYLPVAGKTNMMLVMSARGWVQVCQNLLSSSYSEAIQLGEAIRSELQFSAPRLLRHATRKDSFVHGIQQEFERLVTAANTYVSARLETRSLSCDHPSTPSLDLMLPSGVLEDTLVEDLKFHDNRYGWIGQQLQRTAVRFGWDAVALAEIRDLNRHRTGTKTCPLLPLGFYSALDQLPDAIDGAPAYRSQLSALTEVGRRSSERALQLLREGRPEFIYFTLLGTQYRFEHVTTADKFLYEAELRTGTGAHFRYAQHLHDVLIQWYQRFPATKGLILEGSAEPE